MDRPAREDDLPCFDLARARRVPNGNAGDTIAVEQELFHLDPGEDCEIWPRANGRRQIAASGRHSRRRTDVQRNGANPIHLYCVEILMNGQATRLQFLLDRAAEKSEEHTSELQSLMRI